MARENWDKEMLRFTEMMEARAAAQPPVKLELPLDNSRELNDGLSLPLAKGGAVMAESEDRWLALRGRRILCRFHRPTAGTGHPVLVYLHGGGWVWGSVDTHDRLMREYAAASGCAVIGVDYALSPEAIFPQALEECAAVTRWVANRGAEWGLDTRRIILGGDSAGGNLAVGTALLLRETDPSLKLRGLLINYGVMDSAMKTPSYDAFATGHFLTREKMDFYWRCYAPKEADRVTPFASPMRADLRGLPPVLVHIAELDVLADENRLFATKLRAAGVAVTEETFPGTIHGFLRALGHVAAADRAARQGGEWLKARFA